MSADEAIDRDFGAHRERIREFLRIPASSTAPAGGRQRPLERAGSPAVEV
jgi:hypothetical protein